MIVNSTGSALVATADFVPETAATAALYAVQPRRKASVREKTASDTNSRRPFPFNQPL